jgi:hypothetical protein
MYGYEYHGTHRVKKTKVVVYYSEGVFFVCEYMGEPAGRFLLDKSVELSVWLRSEMSK